MTARRRSGSRAAPLLHPVRPALPAALLPRLLAARAAARAAALAPVSLLVLLLLLPAHLGGCTVAQLSEDVQAGQARVHDKQQVLAARETRRDQIAAESRDLDARLRQDALSLADLQSVLDDLKRENARAAAGRAQQSETRGALREQLQQAQTELDALRRDTPRQPAAQPSGDARFREAQARQTRLQQKLRRLLQLMSKAG